MHCIIIRPMKLFTALPLTGDFRYKIKNAYLSFAKCNSLFIRNFLLIIFSALSFGLTSGAQASDCSVSDQAISKLLSDYSFYGAISDRVKTDQIFQELHKQIFELHDSGQSDPCFESS